jgi:hypothetical protein
MPIPDRLYIAACGMNCSICMAFLRERNKCPGCRIIDPEKVKTRLHCIIRNCDKLQNNFCFGCSIFPCKRLQSLDKRYRTKYRMSMIENLNHIGIIGMDSFLKSENLRWTCSTCNGTICVHRGYCLTCGK